jgi:hypothetical protein
LQRHNVSDQQISEAKKYVKVSIWAVEIKSRPWKKRKPKSICWSYWMNFLVVWLPVPADLPNNLLLFVKCLLTSFARSFPYERKRLNRKARIETKGCAWKWDAQCF